MTLVEIINKLLSKREQYKQLRSAWFQNILIVESTILGAIVALSDNSKESIYVRIAFVLTIALLILGILSAVIALYYDNACAKLAIKAIREQIHKMKEGNGTDEAIYAEDAKSFLFFDILTYIFFSLSFISLMGYTVLKNIPELL